MGRQAELLEDRALLSSVGDFVFHDQNFNGLQDIGEPGIGNVAIELRDAGTDALVSGPILSNSAGFYQFTNVAAGTYNVRFFPPPGLAFTLFDFQMNAMDARDSDARPVGIPSSFAEAFVSLDPNSTEATIDAGLVLTGTIGDRVFNDLNGDGLQTQGEPGIANVSVSLHDPDSGTLVAGPILTADGLGFDPLGFYQFSDVAPGSYHVRFDLPTGSSFTTPDFNANALDAADSDAIPSGPPPSFGEAFVVLAPASTETTIDAGMRQFIPVIVPTTINPLDALQTVFPDDPQSFFFPPDSLSDPVILQAFVSDSAAFQQESVFDLTQLVDDPSTDAALALYDENGNQLAVANANINPQLLGSERLVVDLERGQRYILGTFFNFVPPPNGPNVEFSLDIDTGLQNLEPELAIDLATGAATTVGLLDNATDIDLIPLTTLNGGADMDVSVTPTGLDTDIFATVFTRPDGQSPWTVVTSGAESNGGIVHLEVAAASGGHLTNNEFLLGIATDGFAAPGGSYEVSVQADVIGPATVLPNTVGTKLGTLAPANLLSAQATHTSGTVPIGGGELISFRTPVLPVGETSVTLSLDDVIGLQPVVSLYDRSGSQLIGVTTSDTETSTSRSFLVQADGEYLVRIGDANGDDTGSGTLTIESSFAAQQGVVLTQTVTTLTPFAIDPGASAEIVHLQPAAGTDVLVLSLNHSVPAKSRVRVLSESGDELLDTTFEQNAPALVPVTLNAEDFSVFVLIEGLDVAVATTLTVGQLDVPDFLLPETDLTERTLDLDNGDISQTFSAGGFGTFGGWQHYQLLTSPEETSAIGLPPGSPGQQLATQLPSTVTAASINTSVPQLPPLLARYELDGSGALRLEEFVTSNLIGQPTSLTTEFAHFNLHGVAAFDLGFLPDGDIQLVSDGPDPEPTQLGMVPDQIEKAKSNVDRFIFSYRGATLETESSQHFVQTLFPFHIANGADLPLVTFTPSDPTMAVNVLIRRENANGDFVNVGTQFQLGPGQQDILLSTLDGSLQNNQLKGKKLQFHVTPVPGQPGDGLYTLEMTVLTNPDPYEVTETAWTFFQQSASFFAKKDEIDPGALSGTPVDIIQDHTGLGTASGTFQPGGAEQVHAYRFWAVNRGPLHVRTRPVDNTVNTAIRLYRPRFDSDDQNNASVEYLGQVFDQTHPIIDRVAVTGSRDWFPADRSEIDAQTFVNNFEAVDFDSPADSLLSVPADFTDSGGYYDTQGGFFYVVVKNEQGTFGNYEVEVSTEPFPLLDGSASGYSFATGGRTNYFDSNPLTIQAHHATEAPEALGYYPIQVPDDHTGSLVVTGQTGADWDMHLLDADGVELARTINGIVGFGDNRAKVTFTLPAGPQTVYLRLEEESIISGSDINVSVEYTTSAQLPAIPPPSAPLVSPVPQLLATDPFGNTFNPDTAADFVRSAFLSNGQIQQFTFDAPPAELEIDVVPDTDAVGAVEVPFRWGVYVDGVLRAFDQTRFSGGRLVADSTQTTLSLPTLSDFGKPFLKHTVTIYVESTGSPQNGGDFTIRVQSDATQPLEQADLPLDDRSLDMQPLYLTEPTSNVTTTTNGRQWQRLQIPNGANLFQPVTVTVNSLLSQTTFVLDLYSMDGTLLHSETAVGGISHQFTLPVGANGIETGHSYLLRTGLSNQPDASVSINVVATLNNTASGKQPPRIINNPDSTGQRAEPDPDGVFATLIVPTPTPDTVTKYFWVEEAGLAKFSASLGQNSNETALAVYALEFTTELALDQLTLIDFANRNNVSNGQHELSVWLERGVYAVMAFTASNTAGGLVADLPDYPLIPLAISPQDGNATDWFMQGLDEQGDVSPHEQFRTIYYAVQAPAASRGPFIVKGEVFGALANLGATTLQVWDARDGVDGGFISPLSLLSSDLTTADGLIVPVTNSEATATNTFTPPFEPLFIGLHRNNMPGDVNVNVNFDVPESGVPDYKVFPLTLLADDATTRGDILIQNVGYGSADSTTSQFQIFDDLSQTWKTLSFKEERGLGSFSSRVRSLNAVPNDNHDRFRYVVDIGQMVDPDVAGFGDIDEVDESNNGQFTIANLFDYDKHKTRVGLSIDFNLDGIDDPGVTDTDPFALTGTWGRYFSGVDLPLEVTYLIEDLDEIPDDGISEIARAFETGPVFPPIGGVIQDQARFVKTDEVRSTFFPINLLPKTDPNVGDTNTITFFARDRWGVPSDLITRTIHVEAFPDWLLPVEADDEFLTFDPQQQNYVIAYRNSLLEVPETTLGPDVPLFGNLPSNLLFQIGADGVVSPDPTQPVDVAPFALIDITILGYDIINEKFTTPYQATNNLTFTADLQIDSTTLESLNFFVTAQLAGLPLLNYESPEIPLFSYGIPGVAEIKASLQFIVNAALDAALTLALPQTPNSPFLELGTPTFVGPTVAVGVQFNGDIEIFGFDLASLYGSVSLALLPRIGLALPGGQSIPVIDFFDHDCLDIDGQIIGQIGAELLGIDVFSTTFSSPQFDIASEPGGCVVNTSPQSQINSAPQLIQSIQSDPVTVVSSTLNGNSPVGIVRDLAQPQLVVGHSTSRGQFIQTVDVAAGAAVHSSLAYATRGPNGNWTSLTTVPDPTKHIINPVLRLTNAAPDQSVVVYSALDTTVPVESQSFNDFLSGQNLYYRTSDGVTLGAEQVLSVAAGQDFNPVTTFNSSGQGLVVWKTDSNTAPVSAVGRDRSTLGVRVAPFDPVAGTFGASTALPTGANGIGDITAFVAEDGTNYVVWVQDVTFDPSNYLNNQNALMISTSSDGIVWTTPAELELTQLPASSGTIGEVELIGVDNGRLDLLFTWSGSEESGNQIESRLMQRSALLSNVTAAVAPTTVLANADVSELQTVLGPDGNRTAYWRQSSGAETVIGTTTFSGSDAGLVLSLTSDSDVGVRNPTVAIEADGTHQVVLETRPLPGAAQATPTSIVQSVGVPLAGPAMSQSVALAADFGIVRDIAFLQTGAATGTSIPAGARIANNGLADGTVELQWTEDGVVAFTETLVLIAGEALDVTHDFVIASGAHQYGLTLVPVASMDAITLDDNVSTTDVTGQVDVEITSLSLSSPMPTAGDLITVVGVITNPSTEATGPIRVNLFDANPEIDSNAAMLGSHNISAGLGPNASLDVTFPYQTAAAGEKTVLFARIDPVPNELTIGNNFDYAPVIYTRPDPAFVTGLTSQLLNDSGVQNVRLTATVENLGDAISSVGAIVQRSYEGGPFQNIQTLSTASLAPGESTNIDVNVSGLGGFNAYRIILTPTGNDANLVNNMVTTFQSVQGVANLLPDDVLLSKPQVLPGESLDVSFNLVNDGIRRVEFVNVEIFAHLLDAGRSIEIGSASFEDIEPLSTTPVTIAVDTSGLFGNYQIEVNVDRLDRVLERTETDNRASVDGEVPPLDFGDAPDDLEANVSYATLTASNGPRHVIDDAIFLGEQIDDELDGQPSASADRDDVTVSDDEDGLVDPANDLTLTAGSQPMVKVIVSNNTGAVARLVGWIDYNGDGVFDQFTERAAAVVPDGTSGATVTLTFPVVPSGNFGDTFARFRLSTDPRAEDPTGPASDGEVEDYPVTISVTPSGEVDAAKSQLIADVMNGGPALTNNSFFGRSVAFLGDLAGDGVPVIAVGAHGENSSTGAVYLLRLNPDGTANSVATTKIDGSGVNEPSLSAGVQFGYSVANIGDIDGDGVDDLAIGARLHAAGPYASSGGLYVVRMNSDGTAKGSEFVQAAGLETGDYFGASVAGIGDIDGDGINDIAVGAPGDDDGGSARGAAYVVFLNADGTAKGTPAKISQVANTTNLDRFGTSVAGLGDIDGDGNFEVAIGAYGDDTGGSQRGAVHIVSVSRTGAVQGTPVTIANGLGGLPASTLADDDRFGSEVASIGDLNGDGIPDLAIGAIGDGTSFAGAFYIVTLNADFTADKVTKVGSNTGGGPNITSSDFFGDAIAAIGDVDQDGLTDYAVGVPGYNPNGTDRGGVYILFGVPLSAEDDYGDAPDDAQTGFGGSYPTTLGNNGARHTATGPTLGLERDADFNGVPTPAADGDEVNATLDDEDGVTFVSSIINHPSGISTSTLTVNLQNPNAVSNRLDAWIDFNRDGDWLDTGEQIFVNQDLGVTAGNRTFEFVVPAGNFAGNTYARFRLSTTGGLSPTGAAADGEVEDYQVTINRADGSSAASVETSGGGTTTVGITAGNLHVSRDDITLFSIPNIDPGTGDPGVFVDLAINGTDADDDLLLVDFTGGDPFASGSTLAFNGGVGGNDALQLTGGTFDTVTHTMSASDAGTVSFNPQPESPIPGLFYTGLEPILDELITTHRVFTFAGGTETISLVDSGGADGMSTIDSELSESVTFTNPTGSLTIDAGSGDDTINLTSFDGAFAAALNVFGLDGTDTLNVDAPLAFGSVGIALAATTVNINQPIDAGAADLDIQADTLVVGAAVSGTAFLSIQSNTPTLAVGVGGGSGVLNLDDTELGLIQDGFAGIVIGGGAVDIDSSTFHDNVAFAGESISVTELAAGSNNVTLTALNGITEGGNAGTDIVGNIVTLNSPNGVIGTSVQSPVTTDAVVLATDTSFGSGDQFLSEVNTTKVGLNAGSGTAHLFGATAVYDAGIDALHESTTINIDGKATLGIGSTNNTVARVILTDGTLTGTTGVLTSTQAFDVRKGTISAILDGAAGLTKTTTGVVTLSGANEYAGTTLVTAGMLLVDGSTAVGSAVTVQNGATLGGTGTITGSLNVENGGLVSPGLSPGILHSGNLDLAGGSTFTVELQGTIPGTQHDQLAVTGTVQLNRGDLTVIDAGLVSPQIGDEFVIIANDGTDAVGSIFGGLPEGSLISDDNNHSFVISYMGGDGNDVSLIVPVEDPAVAAPADGQPDDFTLRLNNGQSELVETGSNTPLFSAMFNGISGPFVLNGADTDNDTLRLDFSNGISIPTNGVIFNGGAAGFDSAVVTGGTIDAEFGVFQNGNGTFTAANVVQGSRQLIYNGLEPFTVTSTLNNVTINLDDQNGTANETVTSTVTQGPVNNDGRFFFDAPGSAEDLTLSDPTVALTINGDADDDDVITIASVDTGWAADIIINGGGGLDTINALNSPVGVTLSGGPDDDALQGSNFNDFLDGGSGNDLLEGRFGNDMLDGGSGDDVLAVDNVSFVGIHGGAGNDTLRLDTSGLHLNLTTVANSVITGIETIDLTGDTTPNTLTLNLAEVLALSSTTDTLFVLGDDDTVNRGAGWIYNGFQIINGTSFRVFTQGTATLAIAKDIQTEPLDPISLVDLDGTNGFVFRGEDAFDAVGRSVSSAGDLNGDGFDDLIIGVPGADSGNDMEAGESYVVFGGIGNLSALDFNVLTLNDGRITLGAVDGDRSFLLSGIDPLDRSGSSVSSVGDFNGDGLDDLVIGAPGGTTAPPTTTGEAYLVFGKPAGFPSHFGLDKLNGSTGFLISGFDAADRAGGSVSGAGDVNGDGFDDLIIGAFQAERGGAANAGESYVVFGAQGGFGATLDVSTLDGSNGFRLDGIDVEDASGISVASTGDINGDGFDDLIIGAFKADAGGNADAGESYVVFGRRGGFAPAIGLEFLDGTDGFRIEGIATNDLSGSSVSGAGDVNGDGIDDLIIGAPRANSFRGESYLIFGEPNGYGPVLDLSALGSGGFVFYEADFGDFSGTAVSSAGDVNGDGFDDLLIGAPRADANGVSEAGTTYVVFG